MKNSTKSLSPVSREWRCLICGNKAFSDTIVAKEMMFGLKGEFVYRQCAQCETLQIDEVPVDLGRYYPLDYFSFRRANPAIDLIGKIVYFHGFLGVRFQDPFASIVERFGNGLSWGLARSVSMLDLSPRRSILDVGCGQGHFLRFLRIMGFRNLTGIDPYVERDVREPGITILRKDIFETRGIYDAVTFNDSLEHTSSPLHVLRKANELLTLGGRCLIRGPVAPSYASRYYRENWVQLDAPRHLVIPSVQGYEIMARETGFRILDVEYCSSEFQFWGSEQYLKGIYLTSPSSYGVNPKCSIFDRRTIQRYRDMAAELNGRGEGDTTVVLLEKERPLSNQ